MSVTIGEWDIHAYKWIEAWIDETGPSVLMLVCDRTDTTRVYDPHVEKFVYTASSYEDAMHWLTEDEFTRVNGRMAAEEYWGAE
jgi:hypothetical protein